MKVTNLKMNKKRIMSLGLAITLSLTTKASLGEITSNNSINPSYTSSLNILNNEVRMGKLKGNNVNVRYAPSTKDNNVIGFADKSDCFRILDYSNNWYKVDYLGMEAYIYGDYIEEISRNEEDLNIKKMVYLTSDTNFYSDIYGSYLSTLPMYQNAFVLKEENGYYKVIVDGIIGYINKNNTNNLYGTCVVVDTSRQILKVYKNNIEVYRAHIISGKSSTPSDLGCFKIGHHLRDYQLTPDYLVKYWIQYNGDEGIHDAYWQDKSNFLAVANNAYNNYAKGLGKTYPSQNGSHGCINMKEVDAKEVFDLVSVEDYVLVIGPNNLVRDNIISNIVIQKKLIKSI